MKFPEISKRFTFILNLKQMTAQELSDRSGVGKSSISHYVNGSNEPHNKNAGKLAAVLGCNPQWLMGFDVPMEIPEPQFTGYSVVDFETPTERTVRQLLIYASLLNDKGMEKLKERAEELTEMNKYRKDGDA